MCAFISIDLNFLIYNTSSYVRHHNVCIFQWMMMAAAAEEVEKKRWVSGDEENLTLINWWGTRQRKVTFYFVVDGKSKWSDELHVIELSI